MLVLVCLYDHDTANGAARPAVSLSAVAASVSGVCFVHCWPLRHATVDGRRLEMRCVLWCVYA